MAYVEGYNQRKQSKQVAHLYQQTRVLRPIFVKTNIPIVIAEKSIYNISFYFEKIATYNIIINKYQSAMLIQVINYKDKIVSAPSFKS